jgi:guanylate kinase
MNPLVLSGPPGIGKSTLVKNLYECDFKQVLLTVTREARPGEVPGLDLEFMDMPGYLAAVSRGEFFMDNRFYGNAYGVRRRAVEAIYEEGKIPVATIHMPVVNQFLNTFPNSETIYMMPVSIDFLANRLAKRPQSQREYEYRLNQGIQEVASFDQYRHLYKRMLVIDSDQNEANIELIKSLYIDNRTVEGVRFLEENYSRRSYEY